MESLRRLRFALVLPAKGAGSGDQLRLALVAHGAGAGETFIFLSYRACARNRFCATIPGLMYKAAMTWKSIGFAQWRVWVAAAATLLPLAAATRPAAADPAVTCAYTVSDSWNGGFTADVDITNNGPVISGWTLRWTFTTPTADVRGWSAIITG